MEHVVDGIQNNPKLAQEIASDAAKVCQTLFPNAKGMEENIKNALLKGDAKLALYHHGLGNLTQYFSAKPKEGILFLKTHTKPPQTNYANTLEELLKVSTIIVTSAYPIASDTPEAYPKIDAIPKG